MTIGSVSITGRIFNLNADFGAVCGSCNCIGYQTVASEFDFVNEDTTSSPVTITICVSFALDFVLPQIRRCGSLNVTREVTVPVI
jgi:hypothetical protein